MEFEVHQLQTIKLAVHIAQLVFISVAWILDIVVFRSSASVDGRLGWHFGLVRNEPNTFSAVISPIDTQ